jgi:uncharacterized RDD family membrane protein YckC
MFAFWVYLPFKYNPRFNCFCAATLCKNFMNNNYLCARPLRRLAALFYDLLIIAAISMGYTALALFIKLTVNGGDITVGQPAVGGIWFQCGWALTIMFFYCYFWHQGGQTLGMKAWRMRLVDTRCSGEASNPSWRQCLLRCLFGPVSLLPAGIGYLWCYIDKNGASLHDVLTNTRVIVLPKSR